MEVKVYASKSTLGIIVLVLTIFVIVFAYWGIGKRYEDIEKHQEYQYKNGVVIGTEAHLYYDDEGDEDYTYSAILEVSQREENIVIETANVFYSEPEIGESIPVLYKERSNGTYDYLLVREDWMTGEYIDIEEDYDRNLVFAIVFLALDLFIFGFMLPRGKVQGVGIGAGLVLLGVSGVFLVGFVGNLGGLFLLLFGAIGVLVLHRMLFVSPEKQKQMLEENKNGRLFRVRDVVYNKENGKDMVVFAMVSKNQGDCAYFSYDSEPGEYRVGDWRSANIVTLMLQQGRRMIGPYDTLNVSGVPEDTFQELNEAGKGMVKLLESTGMVM